MSQFISKVFKHFNNIIGLTNENQISLFQNTPMVYTYNEYDYCGNNSDSTEKGKSAVNNAYRKMFPSYNLEVTEGLYHSFKAGGILFIVTDTRTFLSKDQSSFFGNAQKQWIKKLISKVPTDPTTRGVVITLTQVWNYNATAYKDDLWRHYVLSTDPAFDADKKEIGQFILNSGINYLDPTAANYKPLLMVVGEQMVAFDDGLNNKEAGKFPVVVCGGINESQSCKGGPYSHAYFTQANEQYCTINVITNTTIPASPKICFIINGSYRKDAKDEQTFVYNTCYPNQPV